MKRPLSTISSEELSLRLSQKDSLAFEEVYERYWKRLYVYAYKIYEDEAICEDIVQEVFISLWEKPQLLLLNI